MLRSALALALVTATSAFAADTRPMTYAEFLVTVHTRSPAACPEAMLKPGVFCEVAMGPHGIRVFAFSHEGEKPMVAFASYDLAQLEVLPE
ncbi:MAG: hypothetical protein AAF503_09160 [Pseudomonadota bacterium]